MEDRPVCPKCGEPYEELIRASGNVWAEACDCGFWEQFEATPIRDLIDLRHLVDEDYDPRPEPN